MRKSLKELSGKISVVIPALNEEEFVGYIVKTLSKSSLVGEVIVVDNGSTDRTAAVARANGAKVIVEPEKGFGNAMLSGIEAVKNDWVFKADADMRNPDIQWINELAKKTSEKNLFVKGYWSSEEDPMPVTNLVARPSLRKFFPQLKHVLMPLSGIYMFHTSLFDSSCLPKNWSFDLAIMVNSVKKGQSIEQVYLGTVTDTYKPVSNYVDMSYEIIDYLSSLAIPCTTNKYLFVFSSINALLVWCAGTILKLIADGHIVKVILLSENSDQIAEISAVMQFKNLHFEPFNIDTVLSDSNETHKTLSEIISQFRPNTLTTHLAEDPDFRQRRVSQSVLDVVNGYKFNEKPSAIYMCQSYATDSSINAGFEPSVFSDISDYSALKYQIIKDLCGDENQSRIASAVDDLNGFQSGSDKAESFEIYSQKFLS